MYMNDEFAAKLGKKHMSSFIESETFTGTAENSLSQEWEVIRENELRQSTASTNSPRCMSDADESKSRSSLLKRLSRIAHHLHL